MPFLYLDNDMIVRFKGVDRLEDENGNPVTGADVKMTLFKSDGETKVSGASWPITLNEESTDGHYTGILPDGIEIFDGSEYVLEVTAVKGTGNGKWRSLVEARKRYF